MATQFPRAFRASSQRFPTFAARRHEHRSNASTVDRVMHCVCDDQYSANPEIGSAERPLWISDSGDSVEPSDLVSGQCVYGLGAVGGGCIQRNPTGYSPCDRQAIVTLGRIRHTRNRRDRGFTRVCESTYLKPSRAARYVARFRTRARVQAHRASSSTIRVQRALEHF